MDVGELSDRPRDDTAERGGAIGNGVIGGGVIGRGADSNGNGAADATAVDATAADATRPAPDRRAPSGDRAGSPEDSQAEMATLKHEVTHLSSSLGHERDRARTLESNLAAKDGRIGQLEYLMADLNADNAQLMRKNAQLERDNAAMGQAIGDLTANVKGLLAEVAELKAKDARRDQQDAWRDRDIATVKWNDALQDKRLETAETRRDNPAAQTPDNPAKVANKTTDANAQVENQAGPWHFRRSLLSDPAIAFSTTAIGTAVADVATHLRGMPTDVSIIAPGVFGLGAAGIAWIREIRKERNGHRSQD